MRVNVISGDVSTACYVEYGTENGPWEYFFLDQNGEEL